jgi:uncharacterized membrane protein YphA (DoxX/SURF4 family)
MQLVGGIMVIFGAFPRLVSAGFAVVMAGALVFVHPGEPLVRGQDGSGSGSALAVTRTGAVRGWRRPALSPMIGECVL